MWSKEAERKKSTASSLKKKQLKETVYQSNDQISSTNNGPQFAGSNNLVSIYKMNSHTVAHKSTVEFKVM